MSTSSDFAGLVLAAGKGTRFLAESGEPLPKVLRPALGRPIVRYVIDTLEAAGVSPITLVVGYRAEDVISELGDGFCYVHQVEQRGSGHAVACAKGSFEGFGGQLIIMCGDSPLFGAQTVIAMMQEHSETNAAVTLASATLEDPHGYGRILRDAQGRITGIVEEKCADEAQRAVREVNGGAYAFDATWLFANIEQMALNEAGEYNLTDMVRVALEQGRIVSAVKCDPCELLGVNTPEQLGVVEQILSNKP